MDADLPAEAGVPRGWASRRVGLADGPRLGLGDEPVAQAALGVLGRGVGQAEEEVEAGAIVAGDDGELALRRGQVALADLVVVAVDPGARPTP